VKKFNFSLESVLGYRKSVEDDVKRDLSALGKILTDTDGILVSLRGEYGRSVKGLELMQKGSVSPKELEMYLNFQKNLKEKIKSQEEQLNKVKIDWENKKDELVDASKEKKVLEVLKEKKAEEYRYCFAKSDQKEMDEVTSNRFQKAKKGGF
jgi:flagellar FliJ protein